MISRITRRKFAGFSLLLAVATLIAAQSQLFASGGGNKGEIRIEGTLTAVNAVSSFVQIRVQGGANVSVRVLSTTKVERNGVKVKLSALKVGDRAQARIQASTNTTTKLETVGP